MWTEEPLKIAYHQEKMCNMGQFWISVGCFFAKSTNFDNHLGSRSATEHYSIILFTRLQCLVEMHYNSTAVHKLSSVKEYALILYLTDSNLHYINGWHIKCKLCNLTEWQNTQL